MAVHPISPPPAPGGEWTLDAIREVFVAAAEAGLALRDVTYQGTGAQLAEVLGEIGAAVVALEAAEVALVADATRRGEPQAQAASASPADWVALHSGRHTRRSAAVVCAVADATGHPASRDSLGEAVLEGRVQVPVAKAVVTQMTRLTPHLVPDAVPVVWDAFTAYAAATGDPREMPRLREALIAKYGIPRDHEKEHQAAATAESLSLGRPCADGLTEYRLRLGAAAAAILGAALEPLTAPTPSEDGALDPRPYGKRRADALMALVDRAVRATTTRGAGTAPATAVHLIINADDLIRETGTATTIGGLDTGRFLPAAVACRLTCNGALTPIILDPAGNPVVIGRSQRLFTKQQVALLTIRDGGCTFPGCTAPATWGQAHHFIHWADGGTTDLDNAALLCQRHHTVVHTRRLTATLTVRPADKRPPPETRTSETPETRTSESLETSPGADAPTRAGQHAWAWDAPGRSPTQPAPRRPKHGRTPANQTGGRVTVTWDLIPGSYDHALRTHHQREAG